MKRCIAILLAAALVFSTLPAAFGVCTLGATTEQSNRVKAPFHTGDDFVAYRQAVIETLNSCWMPFEAKNDYYSAVYEEALGIYKAEFARLNTLTETEELVNMGINGVMLNDETAAACEKLNLVSSLNLTIIRNTADYETLRAKELSGIKEDFKNNFFRADYNDYYWDKLQCDYEQAVEDFTGAVTYADFVKAQEEWHGHFLASEEEVEDIVEYESYEAVLYYSKEMLAGITEQLYLKLEEQFKRYSQQGYKISKTDKETVLKQFETAATQAPYIEKILKAYHNAESAIAANSGIAPESRKSVSVSVRKRAINRLKKMYLQYCEADYSEDAWANLSDIYDTALSDIEFAKYADELDDAFFADAAKAFTAVKTLALELKEGKAAAIAALKKYVGNKKYNQTKVKALYAQGVKGIQAATTVEKVGTLFDKYEAAMKKAILTFKIAVVKAGKGAVSKSASVKCGANYTVKIVPAAGYKISKIVVDGKKVKLTNAYTFKNVTKVHTIKVTFSK